MQKKGKQDHGKSWMGAAMSTQKVNKVNYCQKKKKKNRKSEGIK